MTKAFFYSISLFAFLSTTTGCALFQTPVCNCAKPTVAICETNGPPITINDTVIADPKKEKIIKIPSSEAANLVTFNPWKTTLTLPANDKKLIATFKKFGPSITGFRGEFATKYGEELVSVMQDKLVFANGNWKASVNVGAIANTTEFDAVIANWEKKTGLKINSFSTANVTDFLRDGVNEVGIVVASTHDPSQRVYRFQIYKTIGQHVAKVFDHPFAIKTAAGSRLVSRIDFIDGVHTTQIRVTPISEDGLLDLTHIQIYAWNRWEGMFRIPKRAPTAPRPAFP